LETDEYKVIKSEEALEGCFLTLRIEPNINIDNIDILTEDLPGLFYHVTKDQEEDKAIISKNKYILNKNDIKSLIKSLLNEIKIKIDT
jgi:hypothetical protein